MVATPRLWKSESQVNSTDGGLSQSDGQIVGVADGGYMIVWTDASRNWLSLPGSTVVGQRYNVLGEKVGGELIVGESAWATASQSEATIAVLPSGNVGAAFVDRYDVPGGSLVLTTIELRSFNSSYVPAGGYVVYNDYTAAANPSITSLDNGSVAVSYTLGSGSDTDIVANIVASDGSVGARFDVHNEADNADSSELATLTDGNFVAVYQDEFNGSTTDIDVKFRIFTATGTAVTASASVFGAGDVATEIDPHVAALENGGFVVVWTDGAGDASGRGIRGTIYNNAGTVVLNGNFAVNTTTAGDQFTGNVVALADGGFVVGWQDGGAGQLRAQRFDDAGNMVGSEFIVRHEATVAGPDMGLLNDGRFALAIDDFLTGDADVVTSIWDPRTRLDFNADGHSDLLFRQTGAIFDSNYEWQLNDRALSGQGAIELIEKSFTVEVIGDFDGDGKADALLQNPTTGGVWEWQLDGTAIQSQGAVDVADPSYHLLGTGDTDGDGKQDVLFRNDGGFVYLWKMDGLTNTPLPIGPLDPVWHVQGTGDFNGDLEEDILLRNISSVPNENGAFFLWQMDGNVVTGGGGIERPPVAWQTLGIGDFDGDGKDDFAVRNVSATPENGAVWVYLMNGTTIKAQGAAGIADAAIWHLQQIGDLDGDGKDDILFRNDAGYFYSWNMNGTTIASEGLLQGAAQWADPSFTVVGQYWDLV